MSSWYYFLPLLPLGLSPDIISGASQDGTKAEKLMLAAWGVSVWLGTDFQLTDHLFLDTRPTQTKTHFQIKLKAYSFWGMCTSCSKGSDCKENFLWLILEIFLHLCPNTTYALQGSNGSYKERSVFLSDFSDPGVFTGQVHFLTYEWADLYLFSCTACSLWEWAAPCSLALNPTVCGWGFPQLVSQLNLALGS